MGVEPRFNWKQCIIVRTDIKMSCGKTSVQVAHAAVMAYERAESSARKSWYAEGQKKVVLKVAGERPLYELREIAERAGIAAAIVQDAGLTEVPPGTVTALGLGPAKNEDLDRITGGLSLL
ncbi:MAG: peptidyl-tRNA hydrolase Pth2 [Methanomicrobiales archaeon]|nr:peptidyl-tRNA hydrolase Pth2 [Methanomicrobiales archaeon]